MESQRNVASQTQPTLDICIDNSLVSARSVQICLGNQGTRYLGLDKRNTYGGKMRHHDIVRHVDIDMVQEKFLKEGPTFIQIRQLGEARVLISDLENEETEEAFFFFWERQKKL
ncbi:hypothetical protein RJT34_17717 [Clitoria ternatea]|uniref:Uncharacterized protein n=1 Tax=Clitoria ternatea TaxID=43366 RepID=A0AAN9J9G4_CLITE